MKRINIFGLGAILAIIAAVVLFVSQTKEEPLSDIALLNIEALSNDETPVGVPCYKDENAHCDFTIKDRDGLTYSATISGMRHI